MHCSTLLSILAFAVAVALPSLAFAETVTYEVREVSRIGARLIAKGTREYSPSDVQVHPYERANKALDTEVPAARRRVPMARRSLLRYPS